MPDRKQLIERLRAEQANAADVFMNVVPTFQARLFEEAADTLERDAAVLESKGTALIARERERQVSAEGWTPEHDDSHRNGELTSGAIAYAIETLLRIDHEPSTTGAIVGAAWWRWELESFRPFVGPRDDQGHLRNLAKAGALIAAEIDRLDRAAVRHTLKSRRGGNGA